MATRASQSKFDQHRLLTPDANGAASEVTTEESARRGPSRKAAQMALSEKVWVGAAPTGKKPAATLKRKQSEDSDEVSMLKSKKAKGRPVAPPSQAKVVAPNKSTSRSKAPAIDLDAASSTDEYQAPVKPRVKNRKVDAIVLAPDSEDSATELSSNDKSKSGSSVTESASEDEGLAGDHASVRQQLGSERTVWTVKDNEASITPKLSHMPAAKVSAKPKAISHREKVQLAETPKFAPVNIKAEAQEHASLTSTLQAEFSTSTDLHEQVGKPLALLSQTRLVKDVIHETINSTLEGIVFIAGFPPAADRTKNGRLVVAAVAAKLGYEEIKNRCNLDTHYVDEIAKVGEARICSLRKVLKEKATTHVVAQYKLQGGCKTLVAALLAGRSYIFPGDVMNPSTVQKGAPYGHPIFAALHAEVFFKTKLSLGNIYPYHFTNSIEGGDPCEREVPPAMLELVATAVHAALLEWADGYYQPIEFSYNRSSDIYDLHLKTIKSIFDSNIHGFHRTLSDLYQDATGRALIAPAEDCDVDFSAMRT